MAKTKLLADIATQAGAVSSSVIALASKLEAAAALTPEHWTALSDIKTEIDKLDQTISKMKAKIASWDGSSKLKNLLKNKAKLAQARDDAKKKFAVLEADVKGLHLNLNDTVKMMQAIANK